MKRSPVARITDGELFELVRSADPIRTSAFAQASEKPSAMLERTIAAARQFDSSLNGRRLTRRHLLLIATALVVVVAAGVGGAFAGGLLSEGSPKVADVANVATSGGLLKRAAQKALTSEKVTTLVVVAAASNGNAGVVEGVRNGVPVSVVTIGSGTGRFAPTSEMLDWAKGLYVQLGTSGSSPNTIGELDIAGIAASATAAVDLTSRDGTAMSLDLGEMSDGAKAFAVSIDPESFKAAFVVAYDKDGKELTRKAIPTEDLAAPGYKGLGLPDPNG